MWWVVIDDLNLPPTIVQWGQAWEDSWNLWEGIPKHRERFGPYESQDVAIQNAERLRPNNKECDMFVEGDDTHDKQRTNKSQKDKKPTTILF